MRRLCRSPLGAIDSSTSRFARRILTERAVPLSVHRYIAFHRYKVGVDLAFPESLRAATFVPVWCEASVLPGFFLFLFLCLLPSPLPPLSPPPSPFRERFIVSHGILVKFHGPSGSAPFTYRFPSLGKSNEAMKKKGLDVEEEASKQEEYLQRRQCKEPAFFLAEILQL